ncbi:GNAT family N-acetyltransferase [Streptomyces sp. NPDC059003]|uniref:GNAT family N-acetyltransferase n=1 Tax=Streptomyces sp. NPDC059003 TaxID=3346691 RepID=UPI0036CD1911
MAAARPVPEGVSLRLSTWKGDPGHRWPGRQIIAVIDGLAAGHLDYYLHPQGEALEVELLLVNEEFQRRGLASLLVDTLAAAHPTAWASPGALTGEGAQWWARYRDRAPAERNIHHRPPADWARHFKATRAAADRNRNVHLSKHLNLPGHGYGYGYGTEPCVEAEFAAYDHYYTGGQELPRVAPTRQELHAGASVHLPAALHRLVHDPALSVRQRAHALLGHLGHGNIPRGGGGVGHPGGWNLSPADAFDDALTMDLFRDAPSPRPGTHVVFHALPVAGRPLAYESCTQYVQYTQGRDMPLELAGLSWRSAREPGLVHSTEFDPPVQACIAPPSPQAASAAYRARYHNSGPQPAPTAQETPASFTPQAAAVHQLAERLLAAREARRRRERQHPERLEPAYDPHVQMPLPPPAAGPAPH